MDVVLLTKSAKHGAYCVAGIDLGTRNWVRLVAGYEDTDALKRDDLLYDNGEEAKPLDVVRVVDPAPRPISRQPENHLAGAGRWEKIREYTIDDVLKIHSAEAPDYLFCNSEPYITGSEDPDSSLLLARVSNLQIYVNGLGKHKATFTYNERRYYDISMTDPDYYHVKMRGIIWDAYVVVSLPGVPLAGDPIDEGRFYKFVAKIFPIAGDKNREPLRVCEDTNLSPIDILKQYFGYSEFREGQEAIISNILGGRDALTIMPTGAGKSMCYQAPALALGGITIVISPLISLMKDQVAALIAAGVPAAYINSSLTAAQYSETLRRASAGRYKIIYIAPERLASEGFLTFARQTKISLLAIDEAHCVSQWGQDFRPSYLKIAEFAAALPERPVMAAFTATATNAVRGDIIQMLGLDKPFVTVTGFNRPNLYFRVIKPKNKYQTLITLLERNKGASGVIYCLSRKGVEEVCASLCEDGYSATRYHAGLDADERRENQDDFIYDRKLLMVATNAFGMGIDKSDVSFVFHYNMPKDLESYYQEAGRAGRDGERAECVLLYSGQDVRTNQFLLEQSGADEEIPEETRLEIRKRDIERLKRMTFYCTTTDCLRGYILRYFGEDAPAYCGSCGNCDANFETVDITNEARKIVACINSMAQRNRRFGRTMIADVLHGSRNERLRQFSLDKVSAYGTMADVPATRIRSIIDFLIEGDFLKIQDEFKVVLLSARSREALAGKPLHMKLPKTEPPPQKAEKKGAAAGENAELFAELRALRARLAAEAGVPAYIVFSDATLRDMCRRLPKDGIEFLEVSGVGRVKMDRYGGVFLEAIRRYCGNDMEL